MEAHDVPILDYINIPNALFEGNNPPPQKGTVSFKLSWMGVNERLLIQNNDPIYGGFAGTFIRNMAQMEWTATVGDFTPRIVADPEFRRSPEKPMSRNAVETSLPRHSVPHQGPRSIFRCAKASH
jgi:hypothetical protein